MYARPLSSNELVLTLSASTGAVYHYAIATAL